MTAGVMPAMAQTQAPAKDLAAHRVPGLSSQPPVKAAKPPGTAPLKVPAAENAVAVEVVVVMPNANRPLVAPRPAMATLPNRRMASEPQQVRVALGRPRRKAQRRARKHRAKGATATVAIVNRVNRAVANGSRHLAQALARVSRWQRVNHELMAVVGVSKPAFRAVLNRAVLNRAA